MQPARRTHVLGVQAEDCLDALMILLAVLVLVLELFAISMPFR